MKKRAFNHRTGQYEYLDTDNPLDNLLNKEKKKKFIFKVRKKHHLPLERVEIWAKDEYEAIKRLPKNVYWTLWE